MASLIEELIINLEKDIKHYDELLELTMAKTPILVDGDLVALSAITDREQIIINDINACNSKRESIMHDISDVIGYPRAEITIAKVVELLNTRPQESSRIAILLDNLVMTAKKLEEINLHNKDLIDSSLKMVEYNINLMQALTQAPETANYNKVAGSRGDVIGSSIASFDAKQ